MSRSLQNPSRLSANSHPFPSSLLLANVCAFGPSQSASRITALSIEFVAKPNEAHKIQHALPTAMQGAFGELAGFAGGFVLVANYEARLVTAVTLWTGEDRLQRCSENVKWVRALLNPYMDRCLRVQTFAAYGPQRSQVVSELVATGDCVASDLTEREEVATYAA